MIDWTTRAKSEILETTGGGTDKTSETPLSSVSSVPLGAIYAKRQGVSSVSSVGGQPLSENRILAAELIAAAMRACDRHGDDKAARADMRRECLDSPIHLQADLLDYFNQTYGVKP